MSEWVSVPIKVPPENHIYRRERDFIIINWLNHYEVWLGKSEIHCTGDQENTLAEATVHKGIEFPLPLGNSRFALKSFQLIELAPPRLLMLILPTKSQLIVHVNYIYKILSWQHLD